MIKQAEDLQDIKRYYPNPIEESYLRYYMDMYFKFPERSNYRNNISKEASKINLENKIVSLRIKCTNKHFHYGRRIVSREITNYKESHSSAKYNEDDDVDDDDDELYYRHEINQIEKLLNEEEEEEELNEKDN